MPVQVIILHKRTSIIININSIITIIDNCIVPQCIRCRTLKISVYINTTSTIMTADGITIYINRSIGNSHPIITIILDHITHNLPLAGSISSTAFNLNPITPLILNRVLSYSHTSHIR